jgi:rubrerythrin
MSVYSVNEVIEMAVQIEHNGYAFYNEALKHKGLDASSQKLLTTLRDQELNHEKTFLALRDEADVKGLEMTMDWELISSYLKTIVESRLFTNETSAIKAATQAIDFNAILDAAINFEKDTLLYFHTIKDAINSEKGKFAVAKIIHEEITHILKLTEFKAIHGK